MDICLLCVLSGRGLCDELITRPEESYRLWRVVVCVCDQKRRGREAHSPRWAAVSEKIIITEMYHEVPVMLNSWRVIIKSCNFFITQHSLVGQDNLPIEGSRTQPHSVGLLWTSDQPHAGDLYFTTHNAHNRHPSMPPADFETAIPCKRAAADSRLRPHGHWDLQPWNLPPIKYE
jgi:hypothetical protein